MIEGKEDKRERGGEVEDKKTRNGKREEREGEEKSTPPYCI
jgi:hypothetical protein